MLHTGALSQKSFKKKIYLAIWKSAGLYRHHYFHATDIQEQAFIQQVFGKAVKVYVAGNFPRVFSLQQATEKRAGTVNLVSIALISPMKNIAVVLDALQYCRCTVHYDLYGPVKDDGYWQQCLSVIKSLPPHIKVQYHGDVLPEKIAATLRASEVFILTSKSENFGHAIFEALSAGKPVITSHHTPFNELFQHQAGFNVAVETVTEIAKAIVFLQPCLQQNLQTGTGVLTPMH